MGFLGLTMHLHYIGYAPMLILGHPKVVTSKVKYLIHHAAENHVERMAHWFVRL